MPRPSGRLGRELSNTDFAAKPPIFGKTGHSAKENPMFSITIFFKNPGNRGFAAQSKYQGLTPFAILKLEMFGFQWRQDTNLTLAATAERRIVQTGSTRWRS